MPFKTKTKRKTKTKTKTKRRVSRTRRQSSQTYPDSKQSSKLVGKGLRGTLASSLPNEFDKGIILTDLNPESITSYAVELPKGTLLYKQKLEKQFELRPQFEWFSEMRGYGTAYGTFTDIYKLNEDLKLFDLGKGRAELMNKYYNVNGADMCDEQYSGSDANMKFHKSIEVFLNQNGYHGTIVREATDSLDCGPSEIVLTPKTLKQTEHTVITKIRSTESPNLTKSL